MSSHHALEVSCDRADVYSVRCNISSVHPVAAGMSDAELAPTKRAAAAWSGITAHWRATAPAPSGDHHLQPRMPLPQQPGQHLLGPIIPMHQPHLPRRGAHAADEVQQVGLVGMG